MDSVYTAPMVRIAAFALILLAGLPVFADSGQWTAALLAPHPASNFRNPAYLLLDPSFGVDWAVRLPVGWLGLISEEANPVPLMTGRPPASNFDLLLLSQYAFSPRQLLLNPIRSPDEVRIALSAAGLSVQIPEGSLALLQGGSSSLRSPTSFLPSPLLSFSYGRGPWVLQSGVIAGGEWAMDQSSPADTEIDVEVQGVVKAGVFQGVSFLYEQELSRATFGYGVRLITYVLPIRGVLRADGSLRLDSRGFPEELIFSSDLSAVVPGGGIGLGGRLDWGLYLAEGSWVWSLGVTGFPAGEIALTPRYGDPTRDFVWIPQGTGSVSFAVSPNLLLAADAGFGRQASAHAGAFVTTPTFVTRLAAGWDEGWKASWTVWPGPGPWTPMLTLSLERNPFFDVYSPAVSVGIARRVDR